MPEIDNIEIRPDPRGFGWLLSIQDSDTHVTEFLIGDAIQFHAETERTLGKWLADGPDDFHAADEPLIGDYDLARDIERGK